MTPITIIPFVIRIQRKQGFSVLWKGIGSVFITKGMLIAFEAIIAELTPFPRFESILFKLYFKLINNLLIRFIEKLIQQMNQLFKH